MSVPEAWPADISDDASPAGSLRSTRSCRTSTRAVGRDTSASGTPRAFDKIRNYALLRLTLFSESDINVAGPGVSPVYRSSDALGLISLKWKRRRTQTQPGLVGSDRTPPVKDVGEPCAGEPHARFDGGCWRRNATASPRQSRSNHLDSGRPRHDSSRVRDDLVSQVTRPGARQQQRDRLVRPEAMLVATAILRLCHRDEPGPAKTTTRQPMRGVRLEVSSRALCEPWSTSPLSRRTRRAWRRALACTPGQSSAFSHR